MSNTTFKAMVISETDAGKFLQTIQERPLESLPEGDVLVKVAWSSLNYKDALSATGNRGVTRNYPHTPGIDAAGTVAESRHPDFQPGDEVIVTSYDLGMNTSGGFGQYIRVPADWVVPLPDGLSLKESMALGTAGFTAGQSVLKLVEGDVKPDSGPILVTGATGGVGSLAVGILAHLGYSVAAATGKTTDADFLKSLGATEIIDRKEMDDTSGRPLLKSRWAGVVDTVGGNYLATALKATQEWAVVTSCGNVASHKLDTTVFPFILRGVTLCGISSQSCPMPTRKRIWDLLAGAWKRDGLLDVVTEVTLEELSPKITAILEGRLKGRTLVKIS